MTVEALALTTEEAVRLTERIRVALDRVAGSWADLGDRVAEAYERRADLALGYDSWEAYAAAELRPSEGIAAEVRRELVGLLSARGMSTRAIAPVIGITDRGVRKAVAAQVGTEFPPEPERINYVTGEVATTPPKTIGLDGKSYARPEPKAPESRRRPIGDVFAETLHELDKRLETLVRLTEDSRFPANRNAVALRSLAQAKKTANTLAGVLAALETNSQKA